MRTRPIRVAGNSGPLRGETSWSELGLPDEHTTVTGKVRRVGVWDPDLARAAVHANGGPSRNVGIALMQLDKECPSLAGKTDINGLESHERTVLDDWRSRVQTDTGAQVRVVGTSPSTVLWIPRAATIHGSSALRWLARSGSGLIQQY
jgi:adenylosuccinate synthase